MAEQFATLTRLGLEPQAGVTAADVAKDRDAALLLKRHPYVAAMHCLARDADGDLTSHPRVTTVDLEHIVGPDSYPDLLRKLSTAAGTRYLLQDVSGGVHPDRSRWVVRFTFDGLTREIHPRLDHDRADPVVMPELFDAVAGPGQGAAHVRHGQTISVAYVPRRHVAELQRVLDQWATTA
ncbi:hypothetical protein [Ornithinimicrobium avium]|uniref:Uncharacterized protein n=1 Tax=Ornithinimicrobium avium TaxID=2283195 RepID=A0A345NNG9_9MICO|nr:hypothetical protein [Ornithinimicrobium avium]AXH96577.1 hypothetical protein DV701_10985 [Ornithinimicrobium avium]